MERKTEHEIDRKQAEEQKEEKKVKKEAERARKNRGMNRERESVSKKQFLAPGPANSSCHSNALHTTQFSSSVHTHTHTH